MFFYKNLLPKGVLNNYGYYLRSNYQNSCLKNNSPKHVELVGKQEESSNAIKPLFIRSRGGLKQIIFVANSLEFNVKISLTLAGKMTDLLST